VRFLRAAAAGARQRLNDAMFERRLGVSTSEQVALEDLGLAHPGRVEYTPSPWRELRRALPPSQVAPDDVFVDIGCGKGRILVLAATTYDCSRVMGVELSEELASTARANLEGVRGRLRTDRVEVVVADAAEWTVPDDVTIVYLYNPFRHELFGAAIDRVLESLDRRPRRLRVVYRHATEHDQLLATGRARLVRTVTPRRFGRVIGSPTNIYELS
jgi:SAM-dependent methyltransferase